MSLPERDGDGYLADMSEWTEEIGRAMADADGYELTDVKWEHVIKARQYFAQTFFRCGVMICRVAPPWCMCNGVITITATITECARASAAVPAATPVFPRITPATRTASSAGCS